MLVSLQGRKKTKYILLLGKWKINKSLVARRESEISLSSLVSWQGIHNAHLLGKSYCSKDNWNVLAHWATGFFFPCMSESK